MISASCAWAASQTMPHPRRKSSCPTQQLNFRIKKIVLETWFELLVTKARPSSRFVDRTKFLGYMLIARERCRPALRRRRKAPRKPSGETRTSTRDRRAVASQVQKSGSVFGFGSGNFCWSQVDTERLKGWETTVLRRFFRIKEGG